MKWYLVILNVKNKSQQWTKVDQIDPDGEEKYQLANEKYQFETAGWKNPNIYYSWVRATSPREAQVKVLKSPYLFDRRPEHEEPEESDDE